MNQKICDFFCKCSKGLLTSLVVVYLAMSCDLHAISDTIKVISE